MRQKGKSMALVSDPFQKQTMSSWNDPIRIVCSNLIGANYHFSKGHMSAGNNIAFIGYKLSVKLSH